MESTLSSSTSQHKTSGRFANTLVKFRNSSLNKLLKINNTRALNYTKDDPKPVDSLQVITQVSKAISEFKELAISADGMHVNYSRLRRSHQYHTYCENIIPQLRGIDLECFSSQQQTTAFWINLYNALVINGVISANIQSSVTEGWLGLLRYFSNTAYEICGMRFSLEDIEHGILRANRGNPYLPGAHFPSDDPRYKHINPKLDPRIHFALNCASQSCPPIQVYTAEELDAQLEIATANFINQETDLNKSGTKLLVSPLFKWYQADFGGKPGVRNFLNKYLPNGERREWLNSMRQKVKIKFKSYNWALNI